MSSTERTDLRPVGVLVAYDPHRDPLAALDRQISAMEHVIVVDNAPEGHPALRNRTSAPKVTILDNHNVGGLAGAYNSALAHIEHRLPEITHVLFLDDDSDTAQVKDFLTSDVTRRFLMEEDVAAIAPAYVERETGLRGTHLRLERFTWTVIPRHQADPTDVSFLINSMSLWKRSALRRIGPFDTRLRVDHIDTDYCLRASALGYRLILNPTITFAHSIGRRRKYRFFGWTLQAGGHSPERRRLIARNTVLLARQWWRKRPAFAALCLVRLGYEGLGILAAENDCIRKLHGLICGALDGFSYKYE